MKTSVGTFYEELDKYLRGNYTLREIGTFGYQIKTKKMQNL